MSERSLSKSLFFNGQYREWIVNIRVKQQALNSPFSIYFFLGPPPEGKPANWKFASGYVGTMGVFASDGSDQPAGPRYGTPSGGMDMSHLRVSGTVPLTSALASKVLNGELQSLDPRDVLGYLMRSLHKRIVKADGTVILDSREVDGLVVKIVSCNVRAPVAEDELPSWGGVVEHFSLV